MLPAGMKGGASNAGRIWLLAALAVLLFAAGCGSSNSDEVSVQTGSLSKAELIKKADAICAASRKKLVAQFYNFLTSHKAAANGQSLSSQKALLGEAIESVVAPNVEGEIKQISALGAPADYAPEVASFLTALQERLNDVHESPAELTATGSPFKQAGEAAQHAGMNGCAASFA
jgi:hypothetical protein